MVDLKIEYTDSNGCNKVLKYDTVMDFLDGVESGSFKEGTNVRATFWENKLITYSCNNIDKLYKHCRDILK